MFEKEVSALQPDLLAPRDWLSEIGCQDIAMESSSIYWKAPYSLLEEAGCRVQILNPFDVKAKRGKKSDQSDAFRIAHMAMHSLVIPSFIPPSVIRDLRTLTRRRSKLVSSLRRAKTMISLLLDEGNFKFTLVGSDLFGVSGRLIMNELAYKSDVSPFYLAGLARGSLQRKVANLVPALSGRLNDVQRIVLQGLLDELATVEKQLLKIEATIEEYIRKLSLEPFIRWAVAHKMLRVMYAMFFTGTLLIRLIRICLNGKTLSNTLQRIWMMM